MMLEQLTVIHLAILIVVGLAAHEVIKLTVARFFAKTVETDYVTVASCALCKQNHSTDDSANSAAMKRSIDQLGQSIDVLRGIVLVLAVRVGVEEKTLQDLANRKGA